MDTKLEHSLEVNSLEEHHRIALEEGTYSIGRVAGNSIVINSPDISRQHAILLRIVVPNSDHYIFRLVDGNLKGQPSTNGLFVNGFKRSSHILRHGDEIVFGGRTKAVYYCTLKPESAAPHHPDLDEHTLDPFGTVLLEKAMTASSADAEMARLVSFVELSPHPIIELEMSGDITYLNPASILQFPDLKQVGIEHPILSELIGLIQNQPKDETSLVREIDLDDKVYQQAIYYLPESQLIRLNMLDITHKRHAESELLKRDALLQAIAQATNALLVELDFETAVQEALTTLGQAAKVDYIFVCQHFSLTTGTESLKFPFEWPSAASLYFKRRLTDCCKVPDEPGIGSWYHRLVQGQAVRDTHLGFANEVHEEVDSDTFKSILLVPLFLKEQYWGFIGFAAGQHQHQWSTHKESSLFALATSISAALHRKQVEESMRHRALYDALTELPNRTLFDEQLSFCLKNIARRHHTLAVMFLDLDRFKTINDTLGHTLGDQLLRSVANRVSHAIRDGDLVARWGGDEFTILLPEIHHIQEAAEVAERILQALDAVVDLDGHELYVTGSIGIACWDQDSHDAETLIKHADIALYQAKELGRNGYQLYNHSLDSKSPELLTLEKDLRRALIREEFIVYYQPRVNTASEKIEGVEALIRWQHPEMGLISPTVFIPLAEANGLIIPIGEWVLRQACLQNKRWQEDGLSPITVAVNLSLKQFRHLDLVESVTRILEETSLEAQYLELEITESDAIENIDFTSRVLKELHHMGVKLSIDDFGTGHSSLNRLQCLHFDNLKIDQSFIRELTSNPKVSHIVSTIVSLGQKLGLHIVAEGVEEIEQLDFLKLINCDTIQGYIFSKPLPAEEIQVVLEAE